jgi:hypothetical protein
MIALRASLSPSAALGRRSRGGGGMVRAVDDAVWGFSGRRLRTKRVQMIVRCRGAAHGG